MNCFMGYNPLVAKEVKITTWIKEFDGESPVYPSFPNDGDCFVVFATDEDALTHNALSKKTYTNGDWADAEGGSTPTGTITITENGEGIDVSSYAYADVNVSGGGGGDFNTAEVTVKVSTEHEGSQFGIYFSSSVEPPYGYAGMFMFSDSSFSYELYTEGDDLTATLYYVGDSVDLILNNTFESCTGNAVFNPDTYKLTISGDCTVTGWTDG